MSPIIFLVAILVVGVHGGATSVLPPLIPGLPGLLIPLLLTLGFVLKILLFPILRLVFSLLSPTTGGLPNILQSVLGLVGNQAGSIGQPNISNLLGDGIQPLLGTLLSGVSNLLKGVL